MSFLFNESRRFVVIFIKLAIISSCWTLDIHHQYEIVHNSQLALIFVVYDLYVIQVHLTLPWAWRERSFALSLDLALSCGHYLLKYDVLLPNKTVCRTYITLLKTVPNRSTCRYICIINFTCRFINKKCPRFSHPHNTNQANRLMLGKQQVNYECKHCCGKYIFLHSIVKNKI